MGLFSGLTKAGVTKKVVDEARKPENQRRIKSAISSFRNRKNGGKAAPPGGTGRG
jgi:hypothetical protein